MRKLLTLSGLILVVVLPAGAQAKAPAGFVGMVSEDTFADQGAYRATQLSVMRASGVTLIRQTFDWSKIERTRGVYDFTYFDGFVEATAKAGIRILPILFEPPTFYSSRPKKGALRGTYPPKRPADMARFASTVAKRYGPKGSFWRTHKSLKAQPIRSWQVWNEPNLPVYWRPRPNAKGYVKLLKATSRALHKVDRKAEVVSAGLPDSRSGVPIKTYITGMLKAGAASAMNTLAINPYSTRPKGTINILKKARGLLDAHGGRRVGLRATELGWSDVGPRSPYRVGKKLQATNVRRLVASLGGQRKALKLRGFIYYCWRDSSPYPPLFKDFWGLHTGLLTQAGAPKASYVAFVTAVKKL